MEDEPEWAHLSAARRKEKRLSKALALKGLKLKSRRRFKKACELARAQGITEPVERVEPISKFLSLP